MDFVKELIERMQDEKNIGEYLESESVKFTVTLESFDHHKLDLVLNELGQKRATFASRAIMAVVHQALSDLNIDPFENFDGGAK